MSSGNPSAVPTWKTWFQERLVAVESAQFGLESRRVPPSFLAASLECCHFALPLASGIGFGLAACRPDRATLTSPLVVLMHALGDNAAFPQWHWIDALTARGFLVLSVEWDGHGPQGPSTLDFQEAARSLPLILQKLYGTPGSILFRGENLERPCFLLGQGVGALYAFAAAMRPDVASVVTAVVCIAPPVVLGNGFSLRKRFGESWWPKRWLKTAFSNARFYGVRDTLAALRVGKRRKVPRVRLRLGVDALDQLQRFLKQTIDGEGNAVAVRVPLLCVLGGRDALVPVLAAQARLAGCRSGLFMHIEPFHTHHSLLLSEKAVVLACDFLQAHKSF